MALVVESLLEELGVPFEPVRIHLEAGEQKRPEYLRINPKGKVPALETPEGVLTESVAICEYLCERHDPSHRWMGPPGSWQRAKVRERVATFATERQPLFSRFFHPDDFSADDAVRAAVKEHAIVRLQAWFAQEDAALAGVAPPESPTVADLHFMVMARWGRWLTPPANERPHIRPHYERLIARPAIARVFARDGIKPYGTT